MDLQLICIDFFAEKWTYVIGGFCFLLSFPCPSLVLPLSFPLLSLYEYIVLLLSFPMRIWLLFLSFPCHSLHEYGLCFSVFSLFYLNVYGFCFSVLSLSFPIYMNMAFDSLFFSCLSLYEYGQCFTVLLMSFPIWIWLFFHCLSLYEQGRIGSENKAVYTPTEVARGWAGAVRKHANSSIWAGAVLQKT